MGCRIRTKRSTTSKQAPERKLNAANAIVVDSLTDDAVAVAHDLGELLGDPRSLVTHDGASPLPADAGGAS
jgi:hypothetical protein